MKIPSVTIAACLAAGVLGGPAFSARLPHPLSFLLGIALFVLVIGCLLAAARFFALAGVASLLAWFLLGGAAALGEPLTVPANHVSRLTSVSAGAQRLDLSQPMRWRGSLRADPLRLPWGTRYVVNLDQVEAEGRWRAVTGGLRADLYDDRGENSAASEDGEGRAGNARRGEARTDAAAPALRAGDGVELLLRAGPVRNYGDPGAFDYRAFLARQDIDLTGTLRNVSLLTALPAASRLSIAGEVARARGRLIASIDALLHGQPDRAAVARAMLLGDRSFLDSDQIEVFQQTGAYHVLVVAGLHLAVLVAALLLVCRRLRISLGASTLVILVTLTAYVALVEDRPPILRAALMAAAFLLGRLLYRRANLLNAVGLAAIVILVFRPSQLRDASFLLSFLAALTIGGIGVPLLDRTTEKYRRALDHIGDVTRDAAHAPVVAQFRLDLRAAAQWLAARLPVPAARLAPGVVVGPVRAALWVADVVLLSFVIQTGMLPLMAQYFHRISVVAPAANVPALLLTGVIVPIGFAALVIEMALGGIWPAAARLAGASLSFAIGALLAAVRWMARPSWNSYRVPSPPALLLVIFFAAALLLAIVLLVDWGWSRRAALALGAAWLLLGALIAAYPFAPRLPSGRLEVTVLDVGQGDSVFVSFPDGRTMLVDGGGLPGGFYVRGSRPGFDVGEGVVSPYLWSRGIKRLDVVALTHAHEDHLGGLSAVLRNFKVGQLWVGRDVDSPAFRSLIAEATDRGAKVVHLSRGNDYRWSSVEIRTLWPPDDNQVKAATNDDSLVLRLEDGQQALLLAGDIERLSERQLAEAGGLLPVEFLKVPHHGSRTSSTPPFLSAIRPRYAAISVGAANAYGHPNDEVLERLSAAGTQFFRTDRDGAITALTDGSRFDVSVFLGSSAASR